MSISYGCMDMWLVFLTLILLTRFSQRGSREWRRPMGRPHASWLQQVDQHLKELGMGQAYAWEMARRRPLEYEQKVDAVTLCSSSCSDT